MAGPRPGSLPESRWSPMMQEGARPRILFVDDEPDLLAAMARNLRSEQFEVSTASSGAQALEMLRNAGPFAVIVSDLHMPAMDGVEVLRRARRLCPDTVRVLFTGQPDLDNAIAAVNEGAIFRFMIKPCPRIRLALTLRGAADQYHLITAERVLLEQTLHGSIKALTDILGLASPMAFGRATRLRQAVGALGSTLEVSERWHIEVAHRGGGHVVANRLRDSSPGHHRESLPGRSPQRGGRKDDATYSPGGGADPGPYSAVGAGSRNPTLPAQAL